MSRPATRRAGRQKRRIPVWRRKGRQSTAFLYDAFISYSRRDLDASDKIERDLESFPLPREIRKRLGRRNLNVFRDISDMTGNRLDPAVELRPRESQVGTTRIERATRGQVRAPARRLLRDSLLDDRQLLGKPCGPAYFDERVHHRGGQLVRVFERPPVR